MQSIVVYFPFTPLVFSQAPVAENRSLYLLLIQTSPFLPPGCPALKAVRPSLGFGGRAGLPGRRLQVMACEMTGLLLVGRLARDPGGLFMELLWSFSWPRHL